MLFWTWITFTPGWFSENHFSSRTNFVIINLGISIRKWLFNRSTWFGVSMFKKINLKTHSIELCRGFDDTWNMFAYYYFQYKIGSVRKKNIDVLPSYDHNFLHVNYGNYCDIVPWNKQIINHLTNWARSKTFGHNFSWLIFH